MGGTKYKEIIQECFLIIQQINKRQEKPFIQGQEYLFVEKTITDNGGIEGYSVATKSEELEGGIM